MVSTDLRKALYIHLDDLMDEAFLLGYNNHTHTNTHTAHTYNDIHTASTSLGTGANVGIGMNTTVTNLTSNYQSYTFRQSYLRPLAYSTLVDFIYQMKEALHINQITRAVHLFCIVIHETTLSMGIQVASLRSVDMMYSVYNVYMYDSVCLCVIHIVIYCVIYLCCVQNMCK